jgi:acyl-CoA thioesterase-2
MRRPTSLVDVLTLEPAGPDHFVGLSPAYSWGRVYGGQVVAQALRAACATVPADLAVHSLHANFILGGKPDEPIRYEVDRIRDGRSFRTRRVVARQADGAILNLDASFHHQERDVSTAGAPLPQILPPADSLTRSEWEAFGDVREVPLTRAVDPARSVMWIRALDDLGDDLVLHACAFAYLSDHNPMDAIIASHPLGLSWDTLMTASLDHALWIHRPFRADQWLLFDLKAGGLHDARGLAMGTVHTADGLHVASIAQEGLVRSPRTPGT